MLRNLLVWFPRLRLHGVHFFVAWSSGVSALRSRFVKILFSLMFVLFLLVCSPSTFACGPCPNRRRCPLPLRTSYFTAELPESFIWRSLFVGMPASPFTRAFFRVSDTVVACFTFSFLLTSSFFFFFFFFGFRFLGLSYHVPSPESPLWTKYISGSPKHHLLLSPFKISPPMFSHTIFVLGCCV